MWNTLLNINGIILSLLTVFLIYAAGRAILLLEWKLFVIALILFLIGIIAEVVLAILD